MYGINNYRITVEEKYTFIYFAPVQKRKLFHTVMCSSKLTKNLNFYLDSKTFPIVLFQIFLGIADSFDDIRMID